MKRFLFVISVCLSVFPLFAAQKQQTPLLKMDGAEFFLSDFEDFCLANNYVLDSTCSKKILNNYAVIFESLKLKVREAQSQMLDNDTNFIQKFTAFRSREAEPYLTDSVYYNDMAHKMFQDAINQAGVDGFAEIGIIMLASKGTSEKDMNESKKFADSLCSNLKNGANFADYVRKYSIDASREKGGYYGRVQRSNFQDDIVADKIMALKRAELSEPIPLSDGSYLIVICINRVRLDSFSDHAASIYEFMEQNGYKEKAVVEKGKKLIKENGWNDLTPQQAIAREDSLLESKYPDFRRIVSAYYDGMLMYSVSNKELWSKIQNDTVGMTNYFEKHKKDYKYSEPCFQGYLIKCQNAQQFDSICNQLDMCKTRKDITKFVIANNLTSTEFHVVEGPFAKGKNAQVDNIVFEKLSAKPENRYPYIEVYGSMSNYPQFYEVKQNVFLDYQNCLEARWVKELKARYHAKLNKKELKAFLLR